MGARGETTLQVDGREVRLLFTNRAIADVEQRLGRNIIGMLQGFAQGETGMTEVVTMLRVGMEAARQDARESGPAVAMNTAWKVMDEVGFGQVAAAVMEAVAAVLSYDGAQADEGEDPNL